MKRKKVGKDAKRRAALTIAGTALIGVFAAIVLWPITAAYILTAPVLIHVLYFNIAVCLILIAIMALAAPDIKTALWGLAFGLILAWVIDIVTAPLNPGMAVNLDQGATWGALNNDPALFKGRMDFAFAHLWHWIGIPDGVILVIFTYGVSTAILLVIAYYLYGAKPFLKCMTREVSD